MESVTAALSSQFGLQGELKPLISERDQNFRLRSKDGDFVVKVVSGADSAELVDFQISALRYLQRQQFDRVPRVVDTTSIGPLGEVEDSEGSKFVLRVVTWVDGNTCRGSQLSEAAAHNFGDSIAAFGEAMAGFRHPGEDQALLWDMRRAPELLSLTAHIDDVAVRAAVESALSAFADRTASALSELPAQVIHNDLNGGNVLFEADELVGIIDFGDMLRAPRLIDLAIAAAYLRDVANPFRLIAPLVTGYAGRTAIDAEEGALLFDMIRARLCATVTMLYWRMSERPPDDPYRQKTISEESGAGEFLLVLNAAGRDAFMREVLPD